MKPGEYELFEDIAMSENPGLDGYDRNDLIELWRLAEAVKMVMNGAHRKLTEELARILDSPTPLVDGRILKGRYEKKRTGWRKPQLTEHIVDQLGQHYIDPESGETVKLLPQVMVRALFDPTTAASKLRNAGIDASAYCTEEWTHTLEIIK
jgi:hypothetical protein